MPPAARCGFSTRHVLLVCPAPIMSLLAVKSADASFKDSLLLLQDIFSHFDQLGAEGTSGNLSTDKIGEALRAATGANLSESQLRDMVAAVDLNASGDVQFSEFLKMMDSARIDPALNHPRVTVQDLMDGMGALGNDAVPPEQVAKKEDDDDVLALEDEEEHKQSAAANAVEDPRPALLKEQRLTEEAEYNMTRDDVRAVFHAFDTDGDGRISMKELQAMMMKFGEKYTEDEVHAMIHLVDQSNSSVAADRSARCSSLALLLVHALTPTACPCVPCVLCAVA